MTVYDRIEALRKSKGLYRSKIEKDLGFSNGSIAKWKDSTPSFDKIKKVADYFSVPVDYLTKEKGDDKKSNDRIDLVKEYEKIKLFLECSDINKLYFDDEPADKESIDLLLKQVEISLALIKKDLKK